MRLQGRIFKEGRHWLVEIPILDAMTQGRSRKEAFAMAADLVEALSDRPKFKAFVHPGPGDDFELSTNDVRGLVALLLRRKREASGLSLAQAARRLGAKSRNAYARYEQGASMPTLEQLNKLVAAVAPGRDLVLRDSTAE
jgi:ribosome-binding protein aMBF1 (putative translation factor)